MSNSCQTVFQASDRPQVALITNHGYAGADINIGGAPDTGGQVVYVNSLAMALDGLGYRVTIFARGGFPHFGTDRVRSEPEYLSDHVRYVFVPGGGDVFIRKEDIAVALDEQVDWLDAFVRQEAADRGCSPWEVYEFVNTHYWDAGVIGMQLVERWRDDLAAEAISDLLTGSVSTEALDRMRAERHRRALGLAPACHLGELLIESEGEEKSQKVKKSKSREDHSALGTEHSALSPQSPIVNRQSSIVNSQSAPESQAVPARSASTAAPGKLAQAAARRWVKASWQANDKDAKTLVDAVEKALVDARQRAAPAMQRQIVAEALGEAILELCRGRAERLEKDLLAVDRHVWTPHSLGVLKQENFRDRPPEVCRDLRFCERRNHERTVCEGTTAFAATSAEIAERLRTNYGVASDRIFYFPPCVDRTMFRKYEDREKEAAYRYLAQVSGVPAETLRSARIIFETSRMDQTKRKDLLLDAFALVARTVEDAYLFIGGGPENELFASLTSQRDTRSYLRERAFLTGFIPQEHIGPLFSIADVYASPSEMEGFGMSVSQAAAAGTAVVSSDLTPFTVQYISDDALIVPAGDVEGFAGALLRLLEDDDGRQQRAERLVDKVKVLDWEWQTSALVAFLRHRDMAVAEGKAE